jgi:hypothetical protein
VETQHRRAVDPLVRLGLEAVHQDGGSTQASSRALSAGYVASTTSRAVSRSAMN